MTFTDSSTNTPTSWSWTFGDSTTSTVQNPSHSYTGGGTYTVALTATNAYGQNTNTKTNYITVTGGSAPVANFSGTPTSGNAPLAVTFTDSSTNTPTSWSWNFGDSNTSTVQNPSHTYSAAGTYTVALTATNAYGNNTKTQTNYITVNSGGSAPVAAFTGAAPTGGPTPLAVSFTDQSTNTPTSWSWTFGDGGTSTAQSPSHTYTTVGIYTVTLTATNSHGSNTATYSGYVETRTGVAGQVTQSATSYVADTGSVVSGTLSNTTAEDGSYFVTTDSTSNQHYCFKFYFATGYTASQVNEVRVEFKLKGSRSDTPGLAFYAWNPNSSSWTNFGSSGTFSTSDQWEVYDTTIPANLINSSGSVEFEVCGCPTTGNSNNYNLSFDVMRVVLTLTTPVANFSGTPTSGTVPLAVTFTDSSTNSPTSWSWTFGDSNTSTVQNPSHTYTAAGSYTVALTATNASGYNTCTKNNYIAVGNPPVANFSGTPTSGGPPGRHLHRLFDQQPDLLVLDLRRQQHFHGAEPEPHLLQRGHLYRRPDCHQRLRQQHEHQVQLRHRRKRPGGQLLRHAHQRHGASGGDLHRLLHQQPDRMVVDLRGLEYLHGAEPEPHLHGHGFLHGSADGDQCLRPEHQHEDQLHHRRIRPSGQLLRHAHQRHGASGGDLHRLLHQQPDRMVVDLRGLEYLHGAEPEPHLQRGRLLHGGSHGRQRLRSEHQHQDQLHYRYFRRRFRPGGRLHGPAPTGGPTPLTVSFADQSTNTPTSWSWTFGDGGTSTAQSPSHVYTTVGTYAVALTATNSHGSNTATYPGYVETRTGASGQVTQYASSDSLPTGSVVSGTLSNTNAEDGSYFVLADDASSQHFHIQYSFNTGCAASQVSEVRIELKCKESRNDTPTVAFYYYNPNGSGSWAGFGTSGTWSTSDQWAVCDTTTSSNIIDSSDQIQFMVCGCPTSGNSNNYNLSFDVVRVVLTLTTPVANFSGTPTSGTAPLAVTFTDSSTNSPTAWSWTFGDSNTSTVQNPSHTYTSAGSYTVALTATNSGGNNTCTKTNYITVTGSIPTVVGTGAVAYGTGAITPALPSSLQANDILLLILNTSNQTITIPTPNGGTWTQVGSTQGTGTGGSSGSVALTIFWSRYNGTQGAPTTSDSGDHQIGRIIAIRGATTSGNPWDVTGAGVDATANTTATIPGATTTVANTLVVVAAAVGLPDSNGTANFSAWTNSNLTSLTEQIDNTRAAGVGGGIGVATGGKAAAGAYGNTTVTLASSAKKGMMGIAIKP